MEGLARILIAALFLHQGYHAMTKRFAFHTERLRSRKIPLPHIVLSIGFMMMFCGSILLMLNVHTTIGATLLLLFSIIATLVYQNFWSFKEAERRADKRASFMYNLAVIGGLLMVIVRDQI
jgi:putative oxidoreductase